MSSWYDNVFLAEPEYFDDTENPAVLERCIVKFQEDYPVLFSEISSDEFIALMMRVATNEQPDAAIVQAFIAIIRNHYTEHENKFIEDNYVEEYDKWLEHENAI